MFRFSEREIHTADFRADFRGALRSAVLQLASRANPAQRSVSLPESIQRRRIVDEDAVADSLLGRPVGQDVEQGGVVRFGVGLFGRCGQSLPQTIRSGAAFT